jgi:hypothetical protein
MTRLNLTKVSLSLFLLLFSAVIVGCEEKGPAEKAGESVDKAGKDIKNGLDPRGPAEKVGDKIDNAVGK